MLSKMGLVAGGMGAAALVRSQPAIAATADELKFDGFNNVKDFGAKGDPSLTTPSAERQAMQNCINASKGKVSVYFPPGTYLVDATLLVGTESVLFGHGPLSVIKANSTHRGHITRPNRVMTSGSRGSNSMATRKNGGPCWGMIPRPRRSA
jgi:pectate lyase-like protein